MPSASAARRFTLPWAAVRLEMSIRPFSSVTPSSTSLAYTLTPEAALPSRITVTEAAAALPTTAVSAWMRYMASMGRFVTGVVKPVAYWFRSLMSRPSVCLQP